MTLISTRKSSTSKLITPILTDLSLSTVTDAWLAFFVVLTRQYCTVIQSASLESTIRAVKAPLGSNGCGFSARCVYINKVSEFATNYFIENDKCNVAGIILAGAAEFKDRLQNCITDVRLREKLLANLTIAYGGDAGFRQAITMSADIIKSSRYLEESKMLNSFFSEIAKDNELICYGISQTMKALESGCVSKLLVWDNVELYRYVFESSKQQRIVQFSTNPSLSKKKFTVISKVRFLDWIMGAGDDGSFDHLDGLSSDQIEQIIRQRTSNASIELVSDTSPQGSQFCRGFGGIGGFLLFRPAFLDDETEDEEEEEIEEEEFDKNSQEEIEEIEEIDFNTNHSQN